MTHKKAHEVDSYLDGLTPRAAPALFLVYGEDMGGIFERVQALRALWLGSEAKGENKDGENGESDLQYNELRADALHPACLIDEATSRGLFDGDGARRLIHARTSLPQAAITNAVAMFLEQLDAGANTKDALVVVEAGTLAPAHRLRKSVEQHAGAMALPCYPLQGKDAFAYIRKYLSQHRYTIEGQALNLLAERLAGDKGILQRELERLILYKGDEQLIDVDDVNALIGAPEQNGIQDLAFAIGLGDKARMDMMMLQLESAGIAASAWLFGIRQHFQNLHQVASGRADGLSVQKARDILRPPVHFLRRESFDKQARLWSLDKTRRALTLLHEAEIATRGSFGASLTKNIVSRNLLRIAVAATQKG